MTSADHSFNRIIGQEKAKDLLLRAVAGEKMSHAYLFRGQAGVGKKMTARAFAAYINCSASSAAGACGVCPSCLKFRADSHPDLLVIEPEGAAIKINQIRALKKSLSFPSFEAKYRVVLLTDVQTMRREAANSLLKTLEEPPEDTVLILTGDEAGNILSTIISRCQIIPFHSLPYEQVALALLKDSDMSEENAATLAAIAEGSLGRARILNEKKLLLLRREIIEKLMAFQPDQPEAVETVFALAATAAKRKEDLVELFDLLAAWFRDLMFIVSGIQNKIINHDLMQSLRNATRRWDLEQLSARLRMVQQAKRQLDRNCNSALVCEVLFFGLL